VERSGSWGVGRGGGGGEVSFGVGVGGGVRAKWWRSVVMIGGRGRSSHSGHLPSSFLEARVDVFCGGGGGSFGRRRWRSEVGRRRGAWTGERGSLMEGSVGLMRSVGGVIGERVSRGGSAVGGGGVFRSSSWLIFVVRI